MKPLQGNLDFFLIRASRGPYRLKHKTQGLAFPVVMYGCESWTIKKVEGRRIDAFKL